jgi:hypothetical protein
LIHPNSQKAICPQQTPAVTAGAEPVSIDIDIDIDIDLDIDIDITSTRFFQVQSRFLSVFGGSFSSPQLLWLPGYTPGKPDPFFILCPL